MADNPRGTEGFGLPGDDSGQDDGLDYVEDSAPSRVGMGCSYCGSGLGDCMSPGDHCPIAKKMFAPKPVTVSYPVELVESYASTKPADEGGVWITFSETSAFDGITDLRLHRSELSALRVAVREGHKATRYSYEDD